MVLGVEAHLVMLPCYHCWWCSLALLTDVLSGLVVTIESTAGTWEEDAVDSHVTIISLRNKSLHHHS